MSSFPCQLQLHALLILIVKKRNSNWAICLRPKQSCTRHNNPISNDFSLGTLFWYWHGYLCPPTIFERLPKIRRQLRERERLIFVFSGTMSELQRLSPTAGAICLANPSKIGRLKCSHHPPEMQPNVRMVSLIDTLPAQEGAWTSKGSSFKHHCQPVQFRKT